MSLVVNHYQLGREPHGCKKHVSLSKPPCCEQLHGSSIGDFANVSKKITSIYLTFLSTPELIMMCRVFHLSTFRPPVDNAISCAHCRRRVFLSTVKSNVQFFLGSLDSAAGHLVTLKIILNFTNLYKLSYFEFIFSVKS